MSIKKGIPVRFDNETRVRLERLAVGSGLTVSDLVRLATHQYLNAVEDKGQITIPLVMRETGSDYGKKRPREVSLKSCFCLRKSLQIYLSNFSSWEL